MAKSIDTSVGNFDLIVKKNNTINPKNTANQMPPINSFTQMS